MTTETNQQRFITKSLGEVTSRFFDENVRIDEIHWFAGALTDDGHHLWDVLDLNFASGEYVAKALDLPDEIEESEDFSEWCHNQRKYGWLVRASTPVKQVMRVREDGSPAVMFSWGFTSNLVAYADLLDDALESIFAQVKKAHEEDIARGVAKWQQEKQEASE